MPDVLDKLLVSDALRMQSEENTATLAAVTRRADVGARRQHGQCPPDAA
jgi:hypothetical protein